MCVKVETQKNFMRELDVCLMRGVDKGVVVRLDGTEGIGLACTGDNDDLVYRVGYRLQFKTKTACPLFQYPDRRLDGRIGTGA